MLSMLPHAFAEHGKARKAWGAWENHGLPMNSMLFFHASYTREGFHTDPKLRELNSIWFGRIYSLHNDLSLQTNTFIKLNTNSHN